MFARKVTLVCSVLCLFAACADAAVALRSRTTCQDAWTQKTYSMGDTWFTNGERECMRLTCDGEDTISGLTCAQFQVPSWCSIKPGNVKAVYPDCCPTPVCPEENAIEGSTAELQSQPNFEDLQSAIWDFTAAVGDLEAAAGDAQATTEDLQATNEDLQATNGDLQATNGDLQATNEDLQATNVDLKATNVDLKATNEDLQATNVDLKATNVDLQATKGDLQAANGELKATTGDLRAATGDLQATSGDAQTGNRNAPARTGNFQTSIEGGKPSTETSTNSEPESSS